MIEISFFNLPWFFYPIVFLILLVPFCWVFGIPLNPLTYIEDYLENKRLEEASRLGLTWEEYKKKEKK